MFCVKKQWGEALAQKKRLQLKEVNAVAISWPQQFQLHSSTFSGTNLFVSGQRQKKIKDIHMLSISF